MQSGSEPTIPTRPAGLTDDLIRYINKIIVKRTPCGSVGYRTTYRVETIENIVGCVVLVNNSDMNIAHVRRIMVGWGVIADSRLVPPYIIRRIIDDCAMIPLDQHDMIIDQVIAGFRQNVADREDLITLIKLRSYTSHWGKLYHQIGCVIAMVSVALALRVLGSYRSGDVPKVIEYESDIFGVTPQTRGSPTNRCLGRSGVDVDEIRSTRDHTASIALINEYVKKFLVDVQREYPDLWEQYHNYNRERAGLDQKRSVRRRNRVDWGQREQKIYSYICENPGARVMDIVENLNLPPVAVSHLLNGTKKRTSMLSRYPIKRGTKPGTKLKFYPIDK